MSHPVRIIEAIILSRRQGSQVSGNMTLESILEINEMEIIPVLVGNTRPKRNVLGS